HGGGCCGGIARLSAGERWAADGRSNCGATMVAISVIVPARDARATLGACLDALRREGIPGLDAELLVIDDASTDGMARAATRWGAQVIMGNGRGPAAARNLGAHAARGAILVFLDADTAPRPG